VQLSRLPDKVRNPMPPPENAGTRPHRVKKRAKSHRQHKNDWIPPFRVRSPRPPAQKEIVCVRLFFRQELRGV